uniref:Uncharacterized protein n=1 Tax=Aegilops tauschii subsp. strangulata TaxID=200361 RepID=A0A453MLM1_AEGTS
MPYRRRLKLQFLALTRNNLKTKAERESIQNEVYYYFRGILVSSCYLLHTYTVFDFLRCLP